MAIKIGHASIDERGKANSGAAGDQTGGEVCVRDWWAMGWNVMLRPNNATLAEKSALACERACANNNVGYDQWQRNTLNDKAKAVGYNLSKIVTKCECDCSSLMHVCAIAGGCDTLPYGSNGYTTRTMVKAFVASGDYDKFTDSKYLTSDQYLKRGDILVKEGSHTVMVLEDGKNAHKAESEIVTRVKEGQTFLNNTYTALLAEYCGGKLSVDGEYGPKTRAAVLCVWKDIVNRKYGYKLTPSNKNFLASCKTAAKKAQIRKGATGSLVYLAQIILAGKGFYLKAIDGDFGAQTQSAVREYQKAKKLTVDGIIGAETWYSLFN